jgi:hypothetical protein
MLMWHHVSTGNDPYRVQTNVFMAGAEDLQLVNVGADTSASEHVYGLEVR